MNIFELMSQATIQSLAESFALPYNTSLLSFIKSYTPTVIDAYLAQRKRQRALTREKKEFGPLQRLQPEMDETPLSPSHTLPAQAFPTHASSPAPPSTLPTDNPNRLTSPPRPVKIEPLLQQISPRSAHQKVGPLSATEYDGVTDEEHPGQQFKKEPHSQTPPDVQLEEEKYEGMKPSSPRAQDGPDAELDDGIDDIQAQQKEYLTTPNAHGDDPDDMEDDAARPRYLTPSSLQEARRIREPPTTHGHLNSVHSIIRKKKKRLGEILRAKRLLAEEMAATSPVSPAKESKSGRGKKRKSLSDSATQNMRVGGNTNGSSDKVEVGGKQEEGNAERALPVVEDDDYYTRQVQAIRFLQGRKRALGMIADDDLERDRKRVRSMF